MNGAAAPWGGGGALPSQLHLLLLNFPPLCQDYEEAEDRPLSPWLRESIWNVASLAFFFTDSHLE